jgi:hypothetical protein
MKSTILLINFFIFVASLTSFASDDYCDFESQYPHQGVITLSNGAQIPHPTHSQNFDSYMVYGWVDYAKASEALLPQGLYPFKLGGKALGALSIFDYKKSDIGSFRESYFVILATPNKNQTEIQNIFVLLSLSRVNAQSANKKFAMYHEKVWSNTQTAALMSEEIWGIPSALSTVELTTTPQKHFTVHTEAGPVFEMVWRNSIPLPNLLGHQLYVYAVGPRQAQGQKWSAVKACGGATLTSFNKSRGDSLVFLDPQTRHYFENLSFTPFIKETSRNQKAVQFLPDQR